MLDNDLITIKKTQGCKLIIVNWWMKVSKVAGLKGKISTLKVDPNSSPFFSLYTSFTFLFCFLFSSFHFQFHFPKIKLKLTIS